VAALVASPLWYRKVFWRIEEELRANVEAALAARVPHLEVRVRAAHFAANGIEVRGLSISEPGAAGPQAELVYCDVVFLECRTNPQELLSGEPAITHIRVSDPIVRATRRRDGTFSLHKLFPLPKPPDPAPGLTIENGSIEIFDPLKNPSSMLVLRDVNASITPLAAADPSARPLSIRGYLVSDQMRKVQWQGTVEPESKTWSATGAVDGLEISPELRNSLPEPFAARLEALSGLRAPARLTFKLAGTGTEAVQFSLDGSVARGRVEDSLLPYPLTDVRGDFHCDNGGVTITNLTARDGPTVWEVDRYEQRGFAPKSPFVVKGRGRQVHLDAKWASTLKEPWSRYWSAYDPAGDINLDFTLAFDGQKFRPIAEATFLGNVSYSFHKFPYRLDRSRGTLSIRDDVLVVAATGFAGPQPVSLSGNFLNPGPNFTGWIEIQADKIALDDKLFAAVLEPRSRDTLIAVNPRGTFNIFAKLWRDDPNVRGMHKQARVTLDRSNRASITHDKFPFTLSNLEGTIDLVDYQWTFKELVGTNGPGVVKLTGGVSTLLGAGGMTVEIDARNVALVDELRNALQPRMQHLWDSLRPNGKIDARASVRFDAAERKTSVALRAFPRDDATSIGTSIEPVAFPYRMRLLGGWMDYRDGHAELRQIHAVHGATHMRTEGNCDIWPDGGWQLRLRNVAVDRVRLENDRELVAALPLALRRAVNEMKPTGPMNLKGALDFSKQAPDAALNAGWDVDLMMHQGSLQAGPRLDNIFGRVRLRGSSSGPRYSSQGELALDSLTYKNFQFTEIAGPLWFDNANVFLGTWNVPPGQSGASTSRVTAKLLGGTLAGDCQVRLGAVPQYHLAATLSRADLAQFARENLGTGRKLDGKIAANVELFGTRGPHNLSGSGTIHLSDADVYQLPLMISLLKFARAKPPDATAFTQSDIAFEIQQGEHVILKQINLEGDAINLSGQGELTFDGQTNPIRLRLHLSVGRNGLPIIEGMMDEASRQILLVHVGGTLDHPQTRTEPFPAANQALQQLQPDPQKPSLLGSGGFMRSLGLRR
jgi:hypothetical protein